MRAVTESVCRGLGGRARCSRTLLPSTALVGKLLPPPASGAPGSAGRARQVASLQLRASLGQLVNSLLHRDQALLVIPAAWSSRRAAPQVGGCFLCGRRMGGSPWAGNIACRSQAGAAMLARALMLHPYSQRLQSQDRRKAPAHAGAAGAAQAPRGARLAAKQQPLLGPAPGARLLT